jgi:tetratricopeptide (TPR) repeat protein/transcriptional regulator with XRE-family HTH domain
MGYWTLTATARGAVERDKKRDKRTRMARVENKPHGFTHSFGYWLRRRRKALDLTQEALAQAVACSGFAIRKIEADERRPSRRLAERLAQKLSIPVAERTAFLEAARSAAAASRLQVDDAPVAPADGEAAPFVGRGGEFGLLIGLVARLTAGAGQVALVEGEAGIGKSRLMHELERYCASRGLATLATNCYEIERAMPYQPVIDVVAKALEAATTQTLQKLPAVSLAEIAALVPAVMERIAVPALSADFPEARQARLFGAIVQLLDALALGKQLVVIVDDIQWADDASAQFLHYFARQTARRPLLLVCAYRDEELETHQRLAALVQGIRREAHARHVPLARLRAADTEALVEGLDHPQLRLPGLAARLHRETDGNPFFLTSMLHALAEGEAAAASASELPLPDALRASVRARLAHVPPQARPALDIAAVLGRRFDFETLAAVTSEPEERLLQAVETLVKRRLLREEAEDGCYDFTHDKVREVVYREIGGARRVSLHRAVAEALERRAEGEPDERPARLAEHYERGHAWKKALHFLLLAAERSQKLFAMRDALHWFDRAVALAEAHSDAAEDLMALYARRGGVRAQAGQTDGAVADIQRVLEAARARGEREKARDAVIQLGMAYRRADDYERATQCLTEALAESRAMRDERHAADTLYHLGTVAWSNSRNREAIAYHQEAVEICERLRLDDLVAVQAYHGRGEAHFSSLEPAAAIACYERSIELARRIGDKSYECENLMMIGFAWTGYMGLADYARAEANFNASLDIARKADLQWHMGPTLFGLEHLRACAGHYDEALEAMMKTMRWLESVRQTRYQLIGYDFIGLTLLEAGRPAAAAEELRRGLELAHGAAISMWTARIQANLAIARLRMGKLDIGPELERAADYSRRNGEGYQLARCLEGLAELALAQGDAARSLAHAGELLSLVEAAGLKELVARARRWRGAALLAQKNAAAGREELRNAGRLAAELGHAGLLADIAKAGANP